MTKYNKVNVKLSNTQLKKLKDAVKDNTGMTLRINLNMFDGNDFTTWIIIDEKTKNRAKKCF